jgi:hypothetical protein
MCVSRRRLISKQTRIGSDMAAAAGQQETQLGDLPEACLAYAIALTSPRDACRFAAVSPAFRAAADSDHVWHRFIPATDDHLVRLLHQQAPQAQQPKAQKKEAYLALCDAGGVPVDGRRAWLDKASGAVCYALSARRLALPWDDGEYSWSWAAHPSSGFGEVAELVDCTCMDIHGALPSAAPLTPATAYAAYLVYGMAQGYRGLSYPDQETAVSVGGRVLERRRVCLLPDDAETRKFRGDASAIVGGGEAVDGPRRRGDGWWEMEMGQLCAASLAASGEEVVASFEVLGWYAKRGLLVEAIEFRPVSQY